MRTLDRTRFSKSIQLAAAQVDPKSIPIIKQRCLHDLLKQPRLRGIYERDGSKLIALRPEIRPEGLTLHIFLTIRQLILT